MSKKLFLFFFLFCTNLIYGEGSEESGVVTSRGWGYMRDGREVQIYSMMNSSGVTVEVSTYGGLLVSVIVPDRHGKLENVITSMDTLGEYLDGHPNLGSILGRFAGRIKEGKFSIGNEEHQLNCNFWGHNIHGGYVGFDKILWKAESVVNESSVGVRLSHVSPDGHENFPGKLEVEVTYTLTQKNQLIIDYKAKTNKATHLNLSSHPYWNLTGDSSDSIVQHSLKINSDRYLDTDEERIPTGVMTPVEGSTFDFRTSQKLLSNFLKRAGENYDHCYVIKDRKEKDLKEIATLYDSVSGREMKMYATQPGLVVYTPDSRREICLEAQYFPDTPNRPEFPSTLLLPGQEYKEQTIHVFSVKE